MTEDTARPTVALLGIGTMGDGMARNLLAAGLPLRVWNRTRSKAEPLTEAGAEVADTVAEAVRGADVVITMLYDVDAVAAALDQAEDAFAPGTVLVQQSTVGVAGAQQLAEQAERLGLTYVDAPVLGTKKPADDGTLVVLASGPDEVHDLLAPVFDAIGSRTLWVGPAGAGSRLKLVANGWIMTMLEGIAESLTLARALDLDPALFFDALDGGAMDAPYVGMKGRAMLAGEFAPSFALAGAAKDSALILEAAQGAGVELAALEAAQRYLRRAEELGHGDEDMAAIFLAH